MFCSHLLTSSGTGLMTVACDSFIQLPMIVVAVLYFQLCFSLHLYLVLLRAGVSCQRLKIPRAGKCSQDIRVSVMCCWCFEVDEFVINVRVFMRKWNVCFHFLKLHLVETWVSVSLGSRCRKCSGQDGWKVSVLLWMSTSVFEAWVFSWHRTPWWLLFLSLKATNLGNSP